MADGRFISLSVHYTLAALPEVPMVTRTGDDRVGNILTVHKDFSQDDSTFFVRMVNRWRLERGEQVGDKLRPKQPITYYIDNTVPPQLPRCDEGRRRGVEHGVRGRRMGGRDSRTRPPRRCRRGRHPLRDAALEYLRRAGLRRHRAVDGRPAHRRDSRCRHAVRGEHVRELQEQLAPPRVTRHRVRRVRAGVRRRRVRGAERAV